MSTIEVRVPDIGDFKDVPIVDILIKPGDTIGKEDPLIALESDKATMEVPSPFAGVVKDISVKLGDRVSQGTLVLSMEALDAAPPAAPPAPLPVPAAASATRPAGPVVSTAPPAPAPAPIAPADAGGGAVHGSPSIRRFARELGVALERVVGTGPHGRVRREDVQAFVKDALRAAPAASAPALGLAPWPTVDFAAFGPIERVAFSRIKKIAGPALHRNWVMIPHVTSDEDADITDLEAFRKQINLEHTDVKVTFLAFLIKACVVVLKAFPDFNASLDGDGLIRKLYYSIGFAADTPGGLVVPVIKDADRKGIVEIARETSELAAKARGGKLTMADMQGATFTISSLGGIGGTSFSPIINAPEVAILGVSKAAMKPTWDGSAFVPRLILPLSLSWDHRAVDGAAAARFNAMLATLLADFRRVLL